MKQNQSSAHSALRALRAAMILPVVAAGAVFAQESDKPNWISMSVGGIDVGGNDAAFQRRTGLNGDFYGGIDSFHFQQQLNDETMFSLDGHAMFGLNDYEIEAAVVNDKMGFVRAGYRQFTTWYDGSGGYYGPGPVRWVVPGDDAQGLDRGEFFFEAGLRMEDVPEMTFSYRHQFRNGLKDSTSWGEAVGLTNGYRMAPSAWDIDEERDIFEFDISHTLGNTDLGGGVRYENTSYTNRRFMPRGNTAPAKRVFTQTDGYQSDLFSAHLFSETRFSDRLWLTAGYVFTTIDTDTDGGSRTNNPIFNTATYARDYRYDTMTGGGQISQHVMNLNLMWMPIEDLTITPSVRAEWETIDAWTGFQASPNPRLSTSVAWVGPQGNNASTEMAEFSESLEIRYTGIPDVVLYAMGEWTQGDETVLRQDIVRPAEWRYIDIGLDTMQYTLGANWYPVQGLSFSAQGYHREREQGFGNALGDFVPPPGGIGEANNYRPVILNHDTQTDDFNLRMTWRPASNVTLVTRYDYRKTTIDNQGVRWDQGGAATVDPAVLLATVESAHINSHVLSQSATWSPNGRLYFQGSVHYVMDETETPALYSTTIKNLVPQSDNDYFNGSISIGYLIDDKTDLQAGYYYYSASNFVNNSTVAMPYGTDAEEHAFNVTLTRWLTDSMVWNVRYGYYQGSDSAAGGFNDYNAHVLSTGLQYRF